MDKPNKIVVVLVTNGNTRMPDLSEAIKHLLQTHVVFQKGNPGARRHDLDNLGFARLQQVVDQHAFRRVQDAFGVISPSSNSSGNITSTLIKPARSTP